jgi:hypothetical protein
LLHCCTTKTLIHDTHRGKINVSTGRFLETSRKRFCNHEESSLKTNHWLFKLIDLMIVEIANGSEAMTTVLGHQACRGQCFKSEASSEDYRKIL